MKRQADVDGSDSSDDEFGPAPMTDATNSNTTTLVKKTQKLRKLDHEKVLICSPLF